MKLDTLRISNFQSFGQEPTEITFEDITYLIIKDQRRTPYSQLARLDLYYSLIY